ncbi:MAG: SDR family oxidoreductase [Bacteroidota bacterium]
MPPPLVDLTGRAALVTGASSGIGRAAAAELARRGARVAVNYPNADEADEARATLDAVAQALDGPTRAVSEDGETLLVGAEEQTLALTVRADVSQEEEVEAMTARCFGGFGGLDVLVCNAGIQVKGAAHATDVSVFDEILAVNLRGAYLCCQAALRRWLDEPRTAERPGVIVTVSSVHERIPRPMFASYAVSKFGLHGLTQSLALEYADRHVRVNAIGPGATVTEINAAWKDDPDARAAVADHIPMGRVAEPEEMARVIAFLASDAAPYMTGQTVFVDGGLTLYPAFAKPWSG